MLTPSIAVELSTVLRIAASRAAGSRRYGFDRSRDSLFFIGELYHPPASPFAKAGEDGENHQGGMCHGRGVKMESVDEKWAAEAESRIDAYERGEMGSESLEEVFAKIFRTEKQ